MIKLAPVILWSDTIELTNNGCVSLVYLPANTRQISFRTSNWEVSCERGRKGSDCISVLYCTALSRRYGECVEVEYMAYLMMVTWLFGKYVCGKLHFQHHRIISLTHTRYSIPSRDSSLRLNWLRAQCVSIKKSLQTTHWLKVEGVIDRRIHIGARLCSSFGYRTPLVLLFTERSCCRRTPCSSANNVFSSCEGTTRENDF